MLHFYRSCDVKEPVTVSVCNIDGGCGDDELDDVTDEELFFISDHPGLADIYVEFTITANRMQMCPPIRTSHKIFNGAYVWDESIELPVHYHNLSRDCQLDFAVYDTRGPNHTVCLGRGNLNLFDECGTLKFGKHYITISANGTQKTSQSTALRRIQKDVNKYYSSELVHVHWLDELSNLCILHKLETTLKSSPHRVLTIDLPYFGCDVIYSELSLSLPPEKSEVDTEDPEVLYSDNIAETKHHLQMRSQRRGVLDKHIKPSHATRTKLDEIIAKPPTHILTSDEQDLLWHHRYYLSKREDALPLVLRSVNWELQADVKQAQEVLVEWAEVDISTALGLLSKEFMHPLIREFAVKSLIKVEVEELELILLQLVQALKYEFASHVEKKQKEMDHIQILENNTTDSNDDNGNGTNQQTTKPTVPSTHVSRHRRTLSHLPYTGVLKEFLFTTAATNEYFAHMLYWYLHVEELDTDSEAHVRSMYGVLREQLIQRLQQSEIGSKIAESIHRSLTLMDQLCALSNRVKALKKDRPKKIKALCELLEQEEEFHNINCPLPMNPSVTIKSIQSNDAYVFKSALQPLSLSLIATDGTTHGIIFKNGDDLRQDQLVLQVITLMDRLLKRENLDLKLMPYRCLAATREYGMVERVNATAISATNGIRNFLRERNPDPSAPVGINKDVMDNYVRSLSGYCVITYLLGVGDRHLDNLMITDNGCLFHIDFGFILGRDPKPYPPPMKLTKDMMEAINDGSGELLNLFRSHCFSCFLILRKSARLVLNLFRLMIDSNVNDIALDRDKTLFKVEEKFRLDMDDEGAVKYFKELLDSSLEAFFPRLVEGLHTFAQYFRK
eukprot:m.138242 g.138242  ORF g.138242 m.138242 type:complete len:843 (-) comp13805_c0_seq1:185-2713(-)